MDLGNSFIGRTVEAAAELLTAALEVSFARSLEAAAEVSAAPLAGVELVAAGVEATTDSDSLSF